MKKIIPLFVSFLFVFTLFFGFMSTPVSAGYSVFEDWESYNLGVNHSVEPDSNSLISWDTYHGDDGTIVLSDYYGTGTKSLYFDNIGVGNPDRTRINITYDYGYIGSISICFYLSAFNTLGNNNDAIFFTFYNDTGSVLCIKVNSDATPRYYDFYSQDSTDVWHEFASIPEASGEGYNYFLNITHNNTNIMEYRLTREDGNNQGYDEQGSKSTSDWNNITYMRFATEYWGDFECYFDDISLSKDNLADEDIYGCTDFSGYNTIGDMSTGSIGLGQDGKYIETVSDTTINATFYGFELLVHSAQIYLDYGGGDSGGDSDMSNYYLYLNGNFMGNPVCYYPFNNLYVLQWEFFDNSLILNDEALIIELYHSIPSHEIMSPVYWIPWLSTDPAPPPVYSGFYTHSDSGKIDGLLNGDNYVNRRLQWRAFYDTYTSGGENPDYENAIILTGFLNNHSLYEVPYTYVRTTVFFYTRVNQTTTPYMIHFYNADNSYTEVGQEQNYPQYINDFERLFGYTPLSTGNYTVTMETQGDVELVNHSFYVETSTDIYDIWTYPNPSNYNSEYTIGVYIADGYIYDNYTIAVFDDGIHDFTGSPTGTNINDIDDAFFTAVLNEQTYNYVTCIHNQGLDNYHRLRIFVDIGGEYLPIGVTYTHYLNTGFLFNDFVRTSFNTYEIEEEFLIIYNHHYIGRTVRIRLGALELRDVSGKNSDSFHHTIFEVGTYTLTLEVLLDGTWETLDTHTIYIIEKQIPPTDDFEDIFSMIPLWIKGILGAIITLGFVFMPFIMLQQLDKINFKVDVPPVVYAISGGIGVTLCTFIGLFGWEIMFFICVISAIALVISYVWNEKSD